MMINCLIIFKMEISKVIKILNLEKINMEIIETIQQRKKIRKKIRNKKFHLRKSNKF